jgi:hypothetical protein
MAWATLQGHVIELSGFKPYTIRLSLSLHGQAEPIASPLIYPILIPSITALRSAGNASQRRFTEFRTFGPLIQLDTDVDLGLPERGDLLHFWNRVDGEKAMKYVLTDLKGWTKIVNLSKLKITVHASLVVHT